MTKTLTFPASTYHAVVHREPEGVYWAEVPEVSDCYTQGDNLDEIYSNLKEAIACHLDIEESEVNIRILEMAA